MSNMSATDLRKWAKEEVTGGIAAWLGARISTESLTYDERQALLKQVNMMLRAVGDAGITQEQFNSNTYFEDEQFVEPHDMKPHPREPDKYHVIEVKRANAGGTLFNAGRVENGRFVEHSSIPTHNRDVAQRLVDRLNARKANK